MEETENKKSDSEKKVLKSIKGGSKKHPQDEKRNTKDEKKIVDEPKLHKITTPDIQLIKEGTPPKKSEEQVVIVSSKPLSIITPERRNTGDTRNDLLGENNTRKLSARGHPKGFHRTISAKLPSQQTAPLLPLPPLIKPLPPVPVSPIKSLDWAHMTVESAVALDIDPLEFLTELQELLTDDRDAQLKFLEANGFDKLMSHLLSTTAPISKKILKILTETIPEKEIFMKLFVDSAETVIRVTHLLLKYPNDISIRTLVYQLLSNLAEIPQSLEISGFDVHATLLCAFNYYKSKSTEQHRFEHLVAGLQSEITREVPVEKNSEKSSGPGKIGIFVGRIGKSGIGYF